MATLISLVELSCLDRSTSRCYGVDSWRGGERKWTMDNYVSDSSLLVHFHNQYIQLKD